MKMDQSVPQYATRLNRIYHCDIIPVEKDLIQFCNPFPFRSGLILRYILQQHVHEIVEPQKSADYLFVIFHNDVNPRPYALIHQF